jgi:hypothetical protein
MDADPVVELDVRPEAKVPTGWFQGIVLCVGRDGSGQQGCDERIRIAVFHDSIAVV